MYIYSYLIKNIFLKIVYCVYNIISNIEVSFSNNKHTFVSQHVQHTRNCDYTFCISTEEQYVGQAEQHNFGTFNNN